MKVLSLEDPIDNSVEKLASPVVTKDEDEDEELLGPEVRVTVHEGANCKVVFSPSPTIRELVSDLDKSWGNSKEWMLQLRDGQQNSDSVISISISRESVGLLSN